MKPSTDKNEKLEWETLFIVTHTVVPKYTYRRLMTVIHLANESKHDNGCEIKALTDMVNAACHRFGIFGKYLSRDEMTVKFCGHNSPRQFTHGKPEMFGCKLWSVCSRGGHCFI
jgi:hypothetical protein